jgi:F-type H+-transporting ATPase subunit epsilon
MPLVAELISPERVMFAGEVQSVVLPGVEGDMTILPGHAPLMTMPGFVFAQDAEGKGRRAFVRGGMVEVTGSTITILAERVAAVEELTQELVEEEILHLAMTRDASLDLAARLQADMAISRLEEFKASLKL